MAQAVKAGLFGSKTAFAPSKEAINRVVDMVRSELLEDGTVTDEVAALTALLDKSGCLKEYFSKFEQKEIKQRLDAMTANKTGLETIAAKAANSMDAEVEKYRALQEQAKVVDAAELHTARMELRGGMTAAVREKIKDTFGKSYDYDRFCQADRDVSELLGEPHSNEQRSVLHKLHQVQNQPATEKQNRNHKNEHEL